VQDTEQRSTGSEQGSVRFIVLNLLAFCFIKQKETKAQGLQYSLKTDTFL